MAFPVVLGGGKRLFGSNGGMKPLQMVTTQKVGSDGVLILTYEPKRG